VNSELTIKQRRIFSRPPDSMVMDEREELICTFHASPGFSLGRFLLNAQTHSPSHYYYYYYYYSNTMPTHPRARRCSVNSKTTAVWLGIGYLLVERAGGSTRRRFEVPENQTATNNEPTRVSVGKSFGKAEKAERATYFKHTHIYIMHHRGRTFR